MMQFDCAIIGGGIVGLATASTLSRRQPGCSIVVLEKDADLATHQTGRNSGVIHSGIYYKPGSYKARFAREGNASMVEFCREHGIKHEICGKVIVATENDELPRLENLLQRGLQNGLAVSRLAPEQVREIEPRVTCVGGIRVPSAGIVNYRQVADTYVGLLRANGGSIQTGIRVLKVRDANGSKILETSRGEIEARFVINCAGLFSDRMARSSGADPGSKIVPFRGEYFELVPDKRHLVKTLIYPVPNPDFPFLGVHFTRMIDGTVHVGPNAVLALKREGYRKTDFSMRDTLETLSYSGFWNLVRKHMGEGWMEIRRSLSKALFVRSLQRLIPEVQAADLVPCKAGVRAQALLPNGKLVDDFLIIAGRNMLHVCNAPSPAATASLEIGKAIAEQVPALQTNVTISLQP
jgi:(S)-2-hydroxyglutarate dehydrogenase